MSGQKIILGSHSILKVFILLASFLNSLGGWAEVNAQNIECSRTFKTPGQAQWIKRLEHFDAPSEARTHSKYDSTLLAQGICRVGNEASSVKLAETLAAIDDTLGIEKLQSLGIFKGLLSAQEKSLLENCNPRSCDIKFSDLERGRVTVGEAQDSTENSRISRFQDAILQRIVAFRERGEIFSYEDNSGNRNVSDPKFAPNPAEDAVATHAALLSRGGWSLTLETLDPFPKKYKPAVNVGAKKCIDEGGTRFCREVSLYSNHYFDSWEKWTQFNLTNSPLAGCKGGIFAYYEIMDIDQLKGNRFTRAMLSVQMRKLMLEHAAVVLNERKLK